MITRLPWRQAIKKFRLGAVALHCVGEGCGTQDATEWYMRDDKGPYCYDCVMAGIDSTMLKESHRTLRHSEHEEDTTRSVNQFYSNTRGTHAVI